MAPTAGGAEAAADDRAEPPCGEQAVSAPTSSALTVIREEGRLTAPASPQNADKANSPFCPIRPVKRRNRTGRRAFAKKTLPAPCRESPPSPEIAD
ncbi:hypothetical protein GCM10023195_33550 [Actinoallomurus liliacearum]|uniref:Uncharacterized protein n=1 Tax=Actinoallomurus liliacearum TaxID=1080073 RepID=A0ABP8TLU9_9ACTN